MRARRIQPWLRLDGNWQIDTSPIG